MKKREREKMKEKKKREMKRGEKLFFFLKMFENLPLPPPPPSPIRQMNYTKMFRKKIPLGRIISPFFFESSESDRVFNYLHESNSIFQGG